MSTTCSCEVSGHMGMAPSLANTPLCAIRDYTVIISDRPRTARGGAQHLWAAQGKPQGHCWMQRGCPCEIALQMAGYDP